MEAISYIEYYSSPIEIVVVSLSGDGVVSLQFSFFVEIGSVSSFNHLRMFESTVKCFVIVS